MLSVIHVHSFRNTVEMVLLPVLYAPVLYAYELNITLNDNSFATAKKNSHHTHAKCDKAILLYELSFTASRSSYYTCAAPGMLP